MAVTYFRFPRSIRFMITFEAAFSASSLDCFAASFASFFARSLLSFASWSSEMVNVAVFVSRASTLCQQAVSQRDAESEI